MRSSTVHEPEWTEQDRAWVFALKLFRSWLCPLCGGPLAECTSHEDTGPEFVVRKIRCRAKDALLTAQDATTNTDRPSALLWTTQLKT